MSQVRQSAGLRRAVSASTAPTMKTPRSARPVLGAKTLPFPSLPFLTNQRGRKPVRCWFDVPAEEYGAGNLTGMRAFGAYMAALQAGESFWQIGVLQAVFAALGESSDLPSRRGAAVGFLNRLCETLQISAYRVDHQALVEASVTNLQAWQAEDARRAADEKAAFVARMAAARATKAAARATKQGAERG